MLEAALYRALSKQFCLHRREEKKVQAKDRSKRLILILQMFIINFAQLIEARDVRGKTEKRFPKQLAARETTKRVKGCRANILFISGSFSRSCLFSGTVYDEIVYTVTFQRECTSICINCFNIPRLGCRVKRNFGSCTCMVDCRRTLINPDVSSVPIQMLWLQNEERREFSFFPPVRWFRPLNVASQLVYCLQMADMIEQENRSSPSFIQLHQAGSNTIIELARQKKHLCCISSVWTELLFLVLHVIALSPTE